MFENLFGKKKPITEKPVTEEPKLDKILSCAKYIIDNGELIEDNTFDRDIPHVKFKDDENNTLYLSWYGSTGKVYDIFMNNRPVPTEYDYEIFKMAQDRVQVLQKKNLEGTINSVKGLKMSDEKIRDNKYFSGEKFDISPCFLLKEVAQRAEYWSRMADGRYCVPVGQDGQIYEMLIAAHKKIGNKNINLESGWVKTIYGLPEGSGHVDCYIFINGEVIQRPWNCIHEYWDSSDYDDFEFSATEPSHWMYKPDIPLPPKG